MSAISIHSRRTITPGGERDAFVLIKNGRIQEVSDTAFEFEGLEALEAGSTILMPGIIDPHVHINEPGRADWEGFDTATKAALFGGITTLVDMPLNSSPVTTNLNALNEKLIAAKGQLHTDCGFWGGIVPGNQKDIQPLIDNGILGFKAFLTHSGIDDFPNVTEEDLRKAMPIIAASGLPLLVHCELESGTDLRSGNSRSYNNYLLSRPKEWEVNAIKLMIRLCNEFHCRVHIVHLSSADSLPLIEEAKHKGLPLTVETGQHYLYFNAEDIADGQTQHKCAPPIRGADNKEKLWTALKSGLIDFVATDHSPAPPALKLTGSGDFMKAWGGIASLQFALPALWSPAKERNCPVSDISKWLSSNPAKLIGTDQTKGRIQKGYVADLVIWNEEESFTVSEDIIQHKHKLCPYIRETLHGVVHQTYLHGEKVFDNGNVILNKGKVIKNYDTAHEPK